MDPVTAALNLATEVVKLIEKNIDSQPPELRAAIATAQWQDFMKFREWLEKILPKGTL